MPAISRWSSSADFSGVARSRNRSPISSPLERVSGRLDAEPGEQRMLVQHRLLRKQHEAEPPRVVEDDAGLLGRPRLSTVKTTWSCAVELGALVMEDAGRRRRLRRFDPERAGHAEMADQHGAALEMHGQVFGAPAERGDAPSGEGLGEAFRKGKAQIRPPRLDRDDPSALQAPAAGRAGRFRPREVQACQAMAGWKEAPCLPARKPEMLGDGLADIGKAAPQAHRRGLQARPGSEDGHALARVVGAAP